MKTSKYCKCLTNVHAALGSRAAGATFHAATYHLAPPQLEIRCDEFLCCLLIHSMCKCYYRVTDLYSRAGINVKYVVTEATRLQQQSVKGRAGDVQKLAAYLQGSLHMRYHYKRALDKNQISRGLLSNLFSWVPVNGGNFLVFLYVGMKILNLLISVAQLLILQVLHDLCISW